MRTREEHLEWCRQRAMEYYDAGDLINAVASMASDIKKHPETDDPALDILGLAVAMDAAKGDSFRVFQYLNGFR